MDLYFQWTGKEWPLNTLLVVLIVLCTFILCPEVVAHSLHCWLQGAGWIDYQYAPAIVTWVNSLEIATWPFWPLLNGGGSAHQLGKGDQAQ